MTFEHFYYTKVNTSCFICSVGQVTYFILVNILENIAYYSVAKLIYHFIIYITSDSQPNTVQDAKKQFQSLKSHIPVFDASSHRKLDIIYLFYLSHTAGLSILLGF